MTTPKKPPRSWDVDNLLDLGRRQGEKSKYLKAIPVLILEKWVREGREEGVANYVWTKPLARRIESSGLRPPFKLKATGGIFGSLTSTQKSRNLTRPPLIRYEGEGRSWINLPHYEPLLQKYRQEYRELYPEDYEKLFPEGEPEWEPPSVPRGRTRRREAEPALAESEVQDEVQSLLAPIEQALRDRQQAVERLAEENQKLQAEVADLQSALKGKHQTPHRRIVDEELRNDCAELLENRKYYIDAIRRASVVLEQRLRKAVEGTEVEKLQYGVSLVRYALAKDTGKLVISDIPNEQDGVFQLFNGAFTFVRNPPAHKKVQYTELEAWQTINLIDYLLLLLRQAKPREI
jgi:uncharacterized protein (TIGR02391 family)